MNDIIRLYTRPELRSPNLVAAWPGICNVSLLAASYLEKKINFEKLGEIEASYFFDPIGVVVKNNVVESPQFPQNKFYYWKNDSGGSDIILFIGEDQPPAKGYELANCILNLAQDFQVKRIYTLAAALTRIHPTEQPEVWGAVNNQQLIDVLREHDLLRRGNLQIAGLNGLLLGVAKEKGIEGICLLGEVPAYASRVQNPMAALAVIKVLTTMLGIKIDLAELAKMAVEASERMKQVAAQAMEEYIDYFTEPIWESGDEEEEEED